jgi:hypothetical protein
MSNPDFDKYFAPLYDFSAYTGLQVEILNRTESDIIDMLENMYKDANTINNVYSLFWLWTLGAYEVVRTMTQAKSSFSATVHEKLLNYKRKISKIRIPFAKQEYQGKKGRPISNEASISGMDTAKGDMFFRVEGTEYSVRSLMEEFRTLMSSIKRSDIIHKHQESYKQSKS